MLPLPEEPELVGAEFEEPCPDVEVEGTLFTRTFLTVDLEGVLCSEVEVERLRLLRSDVEPLERVGAEVDSVLRTRRTGVLFTGVDVEDVLVSVLDLVLDAAGTSTPRWITEEDEDVVLLPD